MDRIAPLHLVLSLQHESRAKIAIVLVIVGLCQGTKHVGAAGQWSPMLLSILHISKLTPYA